VGQIGLDQLPDLPVAAQSRRQLSGVTAEFQSERKRAADVAEPLREPHGRFPDQKVDT
jgi:hypothetical protein